MIQPLFKIFILIPVWLTYGAVLASAIQYSDATLWKTVWLYLIRLNIHTPHNSAIPLYIQEKFLLMQNRRHVQECS